MTLVYRKNGHTLIDISIKSAIMRDRCELYFFFIEEITVRLSRLLLMMCTFPLSACGPTEQARKVDMEESNLPWEKVAVAGDSSVTERMVVPGGWLVRTTMNGRLAVTFVGDPAHTWMLPRRP